MKSKDQGESDIRRQAADSLAKFLAIAADFVMMEEPDGASDAPRGGSELVAIGRAAIDGRMRELRIREPARLRTFDQALIQDLVGCATRAMVTAWRSSAASTITPAKPAAGLTCPRALKRPAGFH